MIIFIVIISIIYLFQIVRYYAGLFKLKPGTNNHFYSASIIIPARNEENNIAACLSSLIAQDYPAEKVEIIVVNDNSSDATAAIVNKFCAIYDNIKLVNLEEVNATELSPKKRAISVGIKLSQHELIFTTDADCIAPPEWLKTMVRYFEPDIGVVAGWVVFNKNTEQTLFHKIQSLEFLSLVIAGAGSIGSDMPLIGNGANLAYRRPVFYEVDGFKGIERLKSGDDDLLIQKVAYQTNWKVRFAAEKSAAVSTKPVATLKDFISQRSRWASKGVHYHNPLLVLYLISVYLFYAMLFFTVPVSIIYFSIFPYPVLAFLLKMVFDYLLLFKGTTIAGRKDLLKYFFPAELFQVPYILVVGILGLWGKYNWKER